MIDTCHNSGYSVLEEFARSSSSRGCSNDKVTEAKTNLRTNTQMIFEYSAYLLQYKRYYVNKHDVNLQHFIRLTKKDIKTKVSKI